MPRESRFERHIIERLNEMFPGCVILKNNSAYLQGIPDRIILWGVHWGMFEVKASEDAEVRPNQPYYIDLLNSMSFARFIYPENEEEVLRELQQAFRPRRSARILKRL